MSAILLNQGKLADSLSSIGVPVIVHSEATLNPLQLLRALHRDFEAWRPDVVHTHRYKENILSAAATWWAGGPPLVHTVHGLQEGLDGWIGSKVWLYGWLNHLVTRFLVRTVISVSDDIATTLRQQFSRLHVVRICNGIDVASVKPSVTAECKRKELGIPEGALVIGTVCRLIPIKGIADLLRAVSQIAKRGDVDEFRLVIAGDGPLRGQLQKLAVELGIGDRTLFLGTRTDVYDLLQVFDMFVLPSLHEGVPMALLEAMASACAVVATTVGGVPEVVRDTIDGRLVPPRNVPALAGAIAQLASSALLRAELGAAGKSRIARVHDVKVVASHTKQVYHPIRAYAEAGT